MVLSISALGCNRHGNAASELANQAASNKAIVARFYSDEFVNWDRALVDEMLSPDLRSHDWPEDARTGPEGFWDFYDGVLSAFPDTRYVFDHLIAEGDKVALHWRLLAIHQGEFYGIVPTG